MYIYKEENYIFSTVIDLSEFFEEGAYIKLREPDTKDMIKISKITQAEKENQTEQMLNIYYDLLKNLIVDHNFYINEKQKMDERQLIEILYSRIEVIISVLTKYNEEVAFLSERRKKVK